MAHYAVLEQEQPTNKETELVVAEKQSSEQA